jgi:hypothetical protein
MGTTIDVTIPVDSDAARQERVYSLNTSVFEEIAAMLFELFRAPRPYRRKA